MSQSSAAVGAYGERVAARLLTDAGMRVIDRNWRGRTGEIDVVAIDDREIVFVEVKTRRGASFGQPADAVGADKIRRLRALAAQWLAAHHQWRGPVRFDVVSVWPQRSGQALTQHVRGAF